MSAFALRLAVLPSVLLLLFVVRRNKNSRDPMSLLVWLAVLGAVSTIPAVVVELVGGVLLYYMGLESGTAVYELVNCFFIVAMIEELGKFLGMLILTWKNKNFDHSYDGVIYGVCSSLGFATLENRTRNPEGCDSNPTSLLMRRYHGIFLLKGERECEQGRGCRRQYADSVF